MSKIRILKKGSLAPSFNGTLWNGESFDSATLRGVKIWLAFFRYASCPLCNLRVHEMIKNYDNFQKLGISIVAVFQSSPESIADSVGKQKPPFPLIADPHESLYNLYGVGASHSGFAHPGNLPKFAKAMKAGFMPGRVEGTLTRMPADFLIDRNGMIALAYSGGKIADHIPFDEVQKFAIAN